MQLIKRNLTLALVLTLALQLKAYSQTTETGKLDEIIKSEMASRGITGLSLAVINGGKIVKTKGYGLMDRDSGKPVTSETLFQAGSISKPVSALAALSLVDQGKLSLDEDVNLKLKSWKVPENDFTKTEKVTLRRLLSHTAGLTVHGFLGYAKGEKVPSLTQVLDGVPPANSAPIRVDILPGSELRYSGGGYTVLQQLIIDLTKTTYPRFMQQTVLGKLSMTHSTYEPALNARNEPFAATGYGLDGKMIEDKRHIYPENAAASLWTTPSDLALFALEIQHAISDQDPKVTSSNMVREMLARTKGSMALGIMVEGDGHTRRFMHSGRNEGFDSMMMGYAEIGQGAVIMINGNTDSPMMKHILDAIAREYNWPAFPLTPQRKPIEDKEPEFTAKFKAILEGLAERHFDDTDFTTDMAKVLVDQREKLAAGYKAAGAMKSINLVARRDMGEDWMYRYTTEYQNRTLVVTVYRKKDGKIAGINSQEE